MRRSLIVATALAGALVLAAKNPSAFGQTDAPSTTNVTAHAEYSQYADSNDVYVYTPAVQATLADPLDGWSLSGSYLADIVSAASVDIVSTATPAWHEVRHAATAQISLKPGDFGGAVAGSISREPDYLSLSIGGNVTMDLRNKTVTPLIGYTYGHDIAGRSGTPYSVYGLRLDRHSINAAVNIIADPKTLFTFSSDVILERGPQEKPYRYVPLFAPNVAPTVPNGADPQTVKSLNLGTVAERTPHERNRYALAARLAQRLQNTTFILWERGYTDDWGLFASTTDLRAVFDVGSRVFLWPHLRVHVQSGVSFWQRAYTATFGLNGLDDVPALRTGDRELGPLEGFTAGAGVRWDVGPHEEPSKYSIVILGDGAITHYDKALYIAQRTSAFGAFQFEALFE